MWGNFKSLIYQNFESFCSIVNCGSFSSKDFWKGYLPLWYNQLCNKSIFFFLWLSFDLSQLVDTLKKLFSQCILAKFLAMSKPSKLLWSCLVKSRKLFCVVFYENNNLHMKWPIFPNYGFNADIQHKFCHKCHVWFIVLIYYQHLKLMSGMEVSIIRSKWDVSTWKHIWKIRGKIRHIFTFWQLLIFHWFSTGKSSFFQLTDKKGNFIPLLLEM